ncbi:hypothetical protein [Streptomyces sp. NPDC037389]|uniref:hypothetical protein n=1 Tax=Streptomyces sp. NPDC037389 TaxID=3155369 RepID=UPI0033ECA465
MITLTETLAVDTVDDFLTREDVARLARLVDIRITETGWRPAYVGQELTELPDEVQASLQAAVLRHLPEIQRTFPSAVGCSPWQLIQFDSGEGAVRHLDGIGPDPLASPRHVARIGVTVQDAEAGGEFFFETTSSDDLWDTHRDGLAAPGYAHGMRFTRIAPHDRISRDEPDVAWIHKVSGVPWTTPAGAGTAVVYGAQLIHGIAPVVRGRCRKFITGLVAD